MRWLLVLGGALGVLAIGGGAMLLAVAIVMLFEPRWYRRRWGKRPEGRLAPINSAPFTLSDGRKRSSLYFWAGGGAPYDDEVVGGGLDDAANDERRDGTESRR